MHIHIRDVYESTLFLRVQCTTCTYSVCRVKNAAKFIAQICSAVCTGDTHKNRLILSAFSESAHNSQQKICAKNESPHTVQARRSNSQNLFLHSRLLLIFKPRQHITVK